ncbi:MAG TPA: rRNA maturation RNase YbeY [Burkholderiales bacterium]
MKLEVRVDYASRRPAPPRAAIARWARAALAGRRRGRAQIGVRIVNAAESAALNARYRGRAGPTNVLAFPFEPPPGARAHLLGDLVICAPVVNREARAQGKTAAAHWAHMVVHGVLHLLGYDHRSRAEARTMERREIAVLRRLGYPDPYTLP